MQVNGKCRISAVLLGLDLSTQWSTAETDQCSVENVMISLLCALSFRGLLFLFFFPPVLSKTIEHPQNIHHLYADLCTGLMHLDTFRIPNISGNLPEAPIK